MRSMLLNSGGQKVRASWFLKAGSRSLPNMEVTKNGDVSLCRHSAR